MAITASEQQHRDRQPRQRDLNWSVATQMSSTKVPWPLIKNRLRRPRPATGRGAKRHCSRPAHAGDERSASRQELAHGGVESEDATTIPEMQRRCRPTASLSCSRQKLQTRRENGRRIEKDDRMRSGCIVERLADEMNSKRTATDRRPLGASRHECSPPFRSIPVPNTIDAPAKRMVSCMTGATLPETLLSATAECPNHAEHDDQAVALSQRAADGITGCIDTMWQRPCGAG